MSELTMPSFYNDINLSKDKIRKLNALYTKSQQPGISDWCREWCMKNWNALIKEWT
jgi:hypothetical protein